MSIPKDRHYWSQLRIALTAGHWTSSFPAKTPNGAPLSWSELFRKFNKHCKGYADVVEVASQTHALALLLGVNSGEDDEAENEKASYGSVMLGVESMLLEERVPEAMASYDILMKLEPSNLDSLKLVLAYYAYALGRPSECLYHLSHVPDILNLWTNITAANAGTTRSTTSTLQVPNDGTDTSSSIRTGSFMSAESTASMADVKDGKAWGTTETVRGICLKGMSQEKMSPEDLDIALQTYLSVVPILSLIESEIPAAAAPTSGSGKLEFTSFTRFRELWRWVERLLWRAVILAARKCTSKHMGEDTLWTILSHYRSCSAHWPPTFRSGHRSTINVIHVRAHVLRSPPASVKPSELGKPPAWLSTARSVVNEYRAILSNSTHFPTAGERNIPVEEFVDLCVAVWEASGAIGDHAGWVIDILWWATRLTFNSYRIYRHMTRLFYVSGDTELAKRTLRLYVQVVGKAHEAGGAGVGVDADTDKHWVETLVQGARMLCRIASTGVSLNGIEEAREAGLLIEKARTRLPEEDKELAASVDLAEGIWSLVMAHKEQDPRSRPSRLAHAHRMFVNSTQTFATPSSYYHLALALSRPGPFQNLGDAIEKATSAVEGAPDEIRYWHLLGLLLSATEQWKQAKGVFEHGTTVGEGSLIADEDEESRTATPNGDGRVIERDFSEEAVKANGHADESSQSTQEGPPTSRMQYLLDPETLRIPPATNLLQPIFDHPPPSRRELFEQALQLRMSQTTLCEYIEGAEIAEDYWVEVFRWVAEKRGAASDKQSSKADSRRASADLRTTSDVAHKSEEAPAKRPDHVDPSAASKQKPPALTITPATPAIPAHNGRVSLDEAGQPKSYANYREKRSDSMDRDTSTGKKVQQMLKNRVHKEQARITTISRKIGHGVSRTGSMQLRRTTSAPDFHSEYQHSHYQASSIHSRRVGLGSIMRNRGDLPPSESPPPPPPSISTVVPGTKSGHRLAKEQRLQSDLWLMSAATFRRLGKVEQARGSIQEAEVQDPDNPAVWVQLGLYHMAHGHDRHALEAFQKALFISFDDVPAIVHLCRLYLSSSKLPRSNPVDAPSDSKDQQKTAHPILHQVNPTNSEAVADAIDPGNIDLAAGMLESLTRGTGWDVPEAWYLLAKAYKLQGRRERERECLAFALELSEKRGVRDIGSAIGWCL